MIDEEKIQKLAREYKVPLILSGVGILFLLIALVFLIKGFNTVTPVEFTQKSASESALPKSIRIDIEGAVVRAGVYALSDGARVSDALAAAGGLSKNADEEWIAKNLNKAAKLIDGGKIYIPSKFENGEGKIQNPKSKTQNPQGERLLGVTTGLININTASQTELEALPGVGPVTAQKIIGARPYQTVEELKTKKTVGTALYEKIKDMVSL